MNIINIWNIRNIWNLMNIWNIMNYMNIINIMNNMIIMALYAMVSAVSALGLQLDGVRPVDNRPSPD